MGSERTRETGTQGKAQAITYLEGDWHRYVIEGLCRASDGDCIYIELGVRGCETISQVIDVCEEAHGVDIDPSCKDRMPHGATFWNMTTAQFFEEYSGPRANVIFIDADHSYDAVMNDYVESCRILARDGIVVLHDTWPWHGQRNDEPHQGSGDAWKVGEALSVTDGFTIRRFPGLTLAPKHWNMSAD